MSSTAATKSYRAGKNCANRLNECPTSPAPSLLTGPDDDTCISLTVSDLTNLEPFKPVIFNRYEDFRAAVPLRANRKNKAVIVSLSSWGSYDPLRIYKEDLQQLVIQENVDASFASVVASFGELPRQAELGLACTSSSRDKNGSYSVSYLLRVPDQDSYGNWKIRQMGVYHSFASESESHFIILVQSHPPGSDKFSMRLEQFSSDPETRSLFNRYPFCLHELILDTYSHGWRWYLNVLGNQYLHESKNIGTARMKKDPRWDLTLTTLQNCESLLGELVSLPAVFQATLQVIECLEGLGGGIGVGEDLPKVSDHRAVFVESQRSAEVVIRQAEAMVDLLGNTLDLKNQRDASQVNSYLLKLTILTANDSDTVRVITVLTLFYLPGTFVATMFGMNFLAFDSDKRKIVVSDDVWIYVVVFLGLTGLTMFLWQAYMRLSRRSRTREGDLELKSLE